MRDVGRLAGGEEAVEGLANRADVPAADHDLRHVGPTRRALLDERQHLLGIDGVPERRQPVGDAMHPGGPFLPELPEQVLEPARAVIQEVSEDVHLAPGLVRVQLDARHHLERRMRPGGQERRRDRVDRIVIRHREDAHAAPRGLANELGGRVGAVRRGRVRVEVDAAHGVAFIGRPSAWAPASATAAASTNSSRVRVPKPTPPFAA